MLGKNIEGTMHLKDELVKESKWRQAVSSGEKLIEPANEVLGE